MSLHLIVLSVGLILYSVLHSLLLAPAARCRVETIVPPALFRLLYNIVATVLLGALWVATDADHPVVWDLHGAPALLLRVVQAGAVLLFLVALRPINLMHFLGLRQLRAPVQEGASLVTRGAYALCRHPLYLAACVFFSAWPRMDARWLVIAMWMWLYSYVGSLLEERRLEAQFGQAYREYRRKCPRLLPFRPWRASKPGG